MINERSKRLLKNIAQWLITLITTIGVAIALRVFVLAKFSIPTPSMEPAIKTGDQVIVSKLTPGARLITNFFSLKNGVKPQLKRMLGFAVERNDVLIFNFPYSDWGRLDLDMNLFYAKRCVAIPGDTFYIENGFYKVKHIADTLGCYENQHILSEMHDDAFDQSIFNCFPNDSNYNWTMKNFGPLYVPRKGDVINLDTINIAIYRNIIVYETQKQLVNEDGFVMLGDSIIENYTFSRNYYFMTGDLVFDSKDSRYWGLLPEDHIVGKVAFVWNTKDIHTKQTRWNRFLKKIK